MSGSPPKIVILAGPNGAGKSTLAPKIVRDFLHLKEFVNADTVAAGLSAFGPEGVAIEAGRIVRNRLRELAGERASFAFETTLATRSFAPWLRGLSTQGYEIHLVFVWLGKADLAVQRVSDRVRLGGHAIEEDTIRRRYVRGVNNFHRLYRPLAHEWEVWDNSEVGGPVCVATGDDREPEVILDADAWSKFCGVGAA